MAVFSTFSSVNMDALAFEDLASADFVYDGDPFAWNVDYYTDATITYADGDVEAGNDALFTGRFTYAADPSNPDGTLVSGWVNAFGRNWWYHVYDEEGNFLDYVSGGWNIALFNVAVSDFQTLTNAQIAALILSGDDTVTGSDEADRLNGFAGSDLVRGLGGDDRLDGGSGADFLAGGVGNDTYIVDDARDAVIEFAAEGTDRVVTALSHTLALAVEELELQGAANLSGTGNALDNLLLGNGGNNILRGLDGNDTMEGGLGNDTLTGGFGGDRLVGGDGTDTAYYLGADSGLVASLANAAINTGAARGDTYLSVENLTGTAFDDSLNGNSGANVIRGGAGHDRLKGYGGNDLLAGGAGNDAFIFNSALDAATNVDTISDFGNGDDAIWLDRAIFSAILQPRGTLLASAFKNLDAPGAVVDADDRILYDQSTGDLFYDGDGSAAGGRVRFAALADGTALTHLDLVVI